MSRSVFSTGADATTRAASYIWADTDQRTLDTGRAFAESLLPGCGLAVHSRPEGETDPLFSGVKSADPARAAEAVRERLGSDPQALLAEHRAALVSLQFIFSRGMAQRLPVLVDFRNRGGLRQRLYFEMTL